MHCISAHHSISLSHMGYWLITLCMCLPQDIYSLFVVCVLPSISTNYSISVSHTEYLLITLFAYLTLYRVAQK